MKGKNIAYLLVLVVLVGVAAWLFSGRNETTTLADRKMDYNFTVEDTAAVDKIVIADKTPQEVTLTRTDDGWMVDGKYRARKDAVEVLLMTLNRMEMRNFIPEKLQETVIKRMSVYGKDVEIYKNGELYKEFYVGTEAQDEMATYMMIKGSDAPYAVHIPGFNGYLSSRFFSTPHLWRSRDVTYMDPRDIRSVTMTYPDSTDASFKMEISDPQNISLTRLSDGKTFGNINIGNVRFYLAALGNVKYEGAILPTDPIYERSDSLLASQPVFELEITDNEGETTNLQGYRIKGPTEVFDPDLERPEYDPDRMHGFINEDDMVLIQYYGLRKVLKPLDFFTRS